MRYNTREEMVAMCDEWLEEFAEESTSWSKFSSYHYKHVVERHFDTYISNSAFVESAKKRFKARPCRYAPTNYQFKFKEKGIV